MKVDKERIQKYLYDILSNVRDIENVLNEHVSDDIINNRHILKSIKYSLVEISEAMSLVLQHILAKQYGVPVKGYVDTIRKASDFGIITPELSSRLKPFFDFQNSLVHRYWIIDDRKLLENCTKGYRDFLSFIDAIEKFLGKL